MPPKPPVTEPSLVLFDQVLPLAAGFVRQHAAVLASQLLLIRDVYGCVRIAMDDRKEPLAPASLEALALSFHQLLGRYSPGPDESDVFLLGSRLFDPDAIFSSPDVLSLPEQPGIRLLERQITGQDWLRPPLKALAQSDAGRPAPRRAVLYGVKGGVGRSTALAIWAKHLAEVRGKRVLVVDLDLESPGISSILLPTGLGPDFGLVDYLIEEGVGQGAAILPKMYRSSPFADGAQGEILVVPAHGEAPGDYLAKLSRIYQGIPDGPADFATRIFLALAKLEEQTKPDVVLLDSRAGLHDIAAMAITRLNALVLLFAVNTSQTLAAYQLLFDGFRRHAERLPSFRDNLQAVAALVPDSNRTEYMRSLQTRLYDLFSRSIYESEPDLDLSSEDWTQAVPDVWNYSLQDADAPHQPIPIRWYRWFLDFDPVKQPDAFAKAEVEAAYGDFMSRATELLLGGDQ